MTWLQTYTQSNDEASLEVKAKYPLRDADIEVTELVGKPGSFAVVARLQPQFQLDEIGANFNLVSTVRSQNAA
jgi:predicted component of type VI protein secretion system